MPKHKQPPLQTWKFAVAGGCITALIITVTTLGSLGGMFPITANLLLDIYGGFGYTLTPLGVILGALYGFIDGFILTGLFAVIYNRLCRQHF